MRNIIIGTAGHIDHGKTSLIEAMTGYNGDELQEEKERGITIDLSFTNMKKGDVNVSFIDVPGHEKLIKNMISGVFGFDASLLLIDVKEGIKPQTIEHLEILNLLEVLGQSLLGHKLFPYYLYMILALHPVHKVFL